jgi:hypothetical protein
MVIFAFAKHVVPECMNDSWITSSSINASIWYESLKYLYVGFVTPMGAPTVRDRVLPLIFLVAGLGAPTNPWLWALVALRI